MFVNFVQNFLIEHKYSPPEGIVPTERSAFRGKDNPNSNLRGKDPKKSQNRRKTGTFREYLTEEMGLFDVRV
jgi:hypothetical protein